MQLGNLAKRARSQARPSLPPIHFFSIIGAKQPFSFSMKRENTTPTSDDLSGLDVKPDLTPNSSPAKRAKTTPTKGDAQQGDGSKSRPGPPWTPEMRIKLFEAYQQAAAVNWSVVAGIVSFPRPSRLSP